MKKNSVDLSIIIVNFNTPILTRQCLDSLLAAKTLSDDWDIIVVDNVSTDGSGTELSEYLKNNQQLSSMSSLIRIEKNVGFSAGNNVGIRKSSGGVVLLLNSDTEVSPHAIQLVYKRLEETSAGAATCRLVLPNGSMDPACHRGFPTPWAAITYFLGLEKLFPHSRLFSQYHMGYLNNAKEHPVDAISGAFFMIKREVVNKIGLLDESFFMYGEDIDWAYRIRQQNYSILFIPQAEVLHKKKQSGRSNANKKIQKETTTSFYRTMQLFYIKHYQYKYPMALTWCILRLLDLKIFLS